MRQQILLPAISVLAAAALTCTQCAPPGGSKRSGHVTFTPGGASQLARQKSLAAKKAAENQSKDAPGGQCPSTPDKGNLQDIRNVSQKRVNGTRLTVDQLPSGTYTMKSFASNYSVNSSDINYESAMEYSVQTIDNGGTATATGVCETNIAAGKLASPAPLDGGEDIPIDLEFNLSNSNGNVTVQSKPAVLHHVVGNGTAPVTKFLPDGDPSTSLQPDAKSIMQALPLMKADPNSISYPNAFPTQQTSLVVITQVPQAPNEYQLYLEIPEGSASIPTMRQIFLVYEFKPTPAANPTASGGPQQQLSQGSQTSVVQQQQEQAQQNAPATTAAPNSPPPPVPNSVDPKPVSGSGQDQDPAAAPSN